MRERTFQAIFVVLHLAAIGHAMAVAYHVKRFKAAMEDA